MRTLITASLFAATLLAGGVVSQPSALAQTTELDMGNNGAPRIRMVDPESERMRDDDRCDPRVERCGPPRYRDDDRRADRRPGCSESRALGKAERMGLRRPRVVDVGRRSIEVMGRDRGGERVVVAFGQTPDCPVLR